MNEGTDAKEVVMEFFLVTNQKPSNFPKHMVYAKRLLTKYSKEQLLFALQYFGSSMYSLGYLTDERMIVAISKMVQHSTLAPTLVRGEDIAERNKAKLQRVHHNSWFRESDNFDLLGK